ncbi:siderophore ABC transporter substrate-binding protein [Marisediminicola sp. LYQ85]|uniref:siderophore ABC transporter substrate-binding protein n=1 Tax=Marisediminicola sp. LYQ85 TaxID=3391062 RepID=UPI003982F1A5
MKTLTSATGHPRAAAALIAVAALSLAGCASPSAVESSTDGDSNPATEIEVTHAQGTTTVPVNPETVITFDMASLDTLDALGVEVAGFPQANVPSYLESYAGDEYLDAGTLFEPDYEAVNAAEPDLIVVANRSAEALAELNEIAPTIDLTLDWADYRGSFENNVTTLGEIFEKQTEAESALAEIDDKIVEAQEITADAGTGLVVMTSAGEVTAYGDDSRFGWLYTELGVETAVDNVEEATHGDPVSFEFLLESDPDWLFVIDRDAAIGESGSSAEQVLDNEVVAGMTARSEDQIVYLDSEPWYIVMSGLTAVNDMVDQITESLG